MAHGNVSDLIFLCLLAIAVQLFAFPDTLFQDFGPFKAQFSEKNADMDLIIKLASGLIFMIGATFSGVKWNPKNGKMAGLSGFIAAAYTAYSTFMASGGLQLFYVYALVLFLGALHIFKFPSNPLPPANENVKVQNNHGNFSDVIACLLLIFSLLCFFYPAYLFQDYGPLKAQFSTQSPDLSLAIKFVACLLLMIGFTFSGIKWNPINGKMAGIGGFLASFYAAFSNFKADSDAFVFHIFYIWAVIIFAGAVHIFVFPANPLPAKSSDGSNPLLSGA